MLATTFSNKICVEKRNSEIIRNNKIARNNEIAGNNEVHKWQDFLQNLREIVFAHQCAKTSNFRAIFTRNVRKSLRNFCKIFVQKISCKLVYLVNGSKRNSEIFFFVS